MHCLTPIFFTFAALNTSYMAFQYLARIILRNRLTILIVVGIITLFMGVMISKLKFYYEPTPLLPQSDSLLLQYRGFNKIFGKGENIMVVGKTSTNFFTLNEFNQWRSLQNKLRATDGVEHVFSITDIFSLTKNTEQKVFQFAKVFPDTISSQDQLDSLRNVALSFPFYRGMLYNEDENIFLMMVTLKYEMISTKARIAFMDNLMKIFDDYKVRTKSDLKFSGLPYIRITVGEMIRGEMILFIVLAALVTALILYLLFRSFRIVFFSILVVAVSVVWGLGFMAILGYEITLLTAVIPPLIIVIGVPNCIFLLNKYHREYSLHGNKVRALQRVVQKIGSATFLTNLTTAAGFGTFAFTSIRILNEFGIVASIGVMGVFLVSLMLIPSIFSFLPPPEARHLQHLDNVRIKNTIARVIITGLYHRKMVFTFALVFIAVGIIGLSRVKSNGYMVDDIPHSHPVYIDLKYLEKNFSGVMPLEIVINTQKPKGILQENTLQRISSLQEKLSHYPELSRPLSIVEAAKFARQGYYNGNESQYRLPKGPERAFIMSYLPKNMGSNPLLNRFVDSTGHMTRILYNVADVGTIKMKELKAKIRQDVDSIFSNDSHLVSITGGSIIAAKGNDYLVKSLFISLLAAIVIISVFMAWMFRNPKMVLLSVGTNIIPLLLTAAAMGFIGINLKPSTVIVFSIAFGISVDNSIHFLSKFRQEFKRTRNNTKASVVCAIRETGVSMIYTSIVLFFGFGIFILSSFGGTVSLGLLVSITLFIALFSNLTLLPAVLLTAVKGNPDDSECGQL